MTISALEAAEIFGRHMDEARAIFHAARDSIYDQWLASDMSIVERDRRMAAAARGLETARHDETKLYYLNLADPTAWGSAVTSRRI